MRETGQAGGSPSGWKKEVLVRPSDQAHSHLIEKRSCSWLPVAHSPEELTCGSPMNCCCSDVCDLGEELTVVFTTLLAMKCMMKCHGLPQDQLHFQPDCGWTALFDFVWCSVSPRDSECRMAGRELTGAIIIMTTLVTRQREREKKIQELLEFPASLTFSFSPLMLGCTGSLSKSLLKLYESEIAAPRSIW